MTEKKGYIIVGIGVAALCGVFFIGSHIMTKNDKNSTPKYAMTDTSSVKSVSVASNIKETSSTVLSSNIKESSDKKVTEKKNIKETINEDTKKADKSEKVKKDKDLREMLEKERRIAKASRERREKRRKARVEKLKVARNTGKVDKSSSDYLFTKEHEKDNEKEIYGGMTKTAREKYEKERAKMVVVKPEKGGNKKFIQQHNGNDPKNIKVVEPFIIDKNGNKVKVKDKKVKQPKMLSDEETDALMEEIARRSDNSEEAVDRRDAEEMGMTLKEYRAWVKKVKGKINQGYKTSWGIGDGSPEDDAGME